ncbi:MAG TPA: hypothetical protein VKA84_20020 [Gemmatimonadaceae bacterium]|nr:hypothetical protein [Gemmatimonadaceae bacterium]
MRNVKAWRVVAEPDDRIGDSSAQFRWSFRELAHGAAGLVTRKLCPPQEDPPPFSTSDEP